MGRKADRHKYRRKGFSVSSLTWQTIVCILIILLVIATKKMDFAVINRGVAFLEAQLARDYTVSELVEGAKTIAASFPAGNEKLNFIMPANEPGTKAASAGDSSGTIITFQADEEIQVYASGGGTVSLVEPEGSSGIRIQISHGSGMVTEYHGCTDIYVKPLEKVKKGQIIASVRAGEGNELSFALQVDGKLVDPATYIQD